MLERAALYPDGQLEIAVVCRDLGEAFVALAELEVSRALHRRDPVKRSLGLGEVFGPFEDREQFGNACHAEKLTGLGGATAPRRSPERRNPVGDDARIAGHERYVLHGSLGDEEAIEWIALLPAV